MPIPEAQLQTWSHQGAIAQSSKTYNAIKDILNTAATPYARRSFEVFLQGSYGNDTNIYAESDVDVVIRLDDCYYDDLTSLPERDREAYQQAFHAAAYTLVEFKRDVLTALSANYGAAVYPGNKAITIAAGQGRRKADVIVAAQFRRYFGFRSHTDSDFAAGICFFDAAGAQIANYPRQHSDKLTVKHQRSGEWLKPVIRVFKNIRTKLVEDGLIDSGVAPSYFIEGLLYNVPDGKFGTSLEDCVVNAVNWYRSEADKGNLVCANEQHYLLRDGVPTCWPPAHCEAFIDALSSLWRRW